MLTVISYLAFLAAAFAFATGLYLALTKIRLI